MKGRRKMNRVTGQLIATGQVKSGLQNWPCVTHPLSKRWRKFNLMQLWLGGGKLGKKSDIDAPCIVALE